MHAIWAWSLLRVRSRIRTALAYSIAFKALNFLLLAPIAALILRTCLTRWGRASVGNFEVIAFLISPIGIVAQVGVCSLLLATLYLELAGLMQLLAEGRLSWWQALSGSAGKFRRLLALGLRQFLAYLLLAIPFLALIGLAYWLYWRGKDLNGLIVLKPPEFWWGASVAGACIAVYSVMAMRLFARWLLAVPTLLFEPNVGVTQSLQLSSQRSGNRLGHFLAVLVTWAVVQTVLATIVLFLIRWASHWLLGQTGDSMKLAIPVTGIILAVNVLVSALLSVLATTTFAALVLALYRESVGTEFLRHETLPPASRRSIGWRIAVALSLLGVLAVVFSGLALRTLKLRDDVEITAHRAGAAGAPENTVVALTQAIVDGADWAEIDVQLTADQALVVMHDTDLARVGGGDRSVDQVTLAQIRELDVGAPFDSRFVGERIPTFDEMLAAAGTAIRLNVELKPHNKRDALVLAGRVVAAIQAAGMTDRCRICSQSYEGLQEIRKIEPKLEIGYIAANTLGDLAQLDVNFLMVKSNLADRQLVERAGLRTIAIHAWTVNDPALVGPLLDAGVANIITDDPAGMRARLEEIQSLNPVDRLLLRARQTLF